MKPDEARGTRPDGAREPASYAEQVTPPLDAGSEVSEQAREEADALEQPKSPSKAPSEVRGAGESD